MNKKAIVKKILIGVVIVTGVFNIIVFSGIMLNMDVPLFEKVLVNKTEYKEYESFKKTVELKMEIEDKYYKKTDEDKLIDGAVNGMFASLNDIYSYYISKDELEKKKNSEKGIMVGIGISINLLENGTIAVVDVNESGSAKRAGLEVGDIIVKIDQLELNMDNVFDAINIIGKDDRKYIIFGDYETVDIEVLRNKERLKFKVEREKIKDKAFSYEIMDNIGYIKIERFIYGTPDYLKEALDEMNSKGIDKVIIDLRDNPGGLLESVVEVSGYLVGKQKILYTENKSGEKVDYASPNAKLYDGKLCLLVNENSASASEAMSAAMKDYGRAEVVGVNTFGKGIVQTTYSRMDGSGYKLTTNEYFSPKGKKIHTLGVAPDVEVKEPGKQLQTAIELLEKEK